MQAMQEEVQRSLEGLILDRMLPPGFISYHVVDANTLQISSVLGGIVRSRERRIVKFDNRTLILKDGVSNENFLDLDNLGGTWSRYENNIPVTGSKDDVRRALWLVTDENYKNAVSTYESKISAIRQQSLSRKRENCPIFFLPKARKIIMPYRP
jgi:TldD protein